MSTHEGSTPAAWTTLLLIIAGFLVGGLGFVVGQLMAIWVGAGLVVLGGILGKVMQLMGLGSERA